MKQKQRGKSRYTSVVQGAVLLSCVFIVIAVSYAQYVTKNSDEATYSYLKEISYMAEREISAKFEGNLETLRVISSILSITEEDVDFFQKALDTNNKKTELDHVFYADKDGKVFGSSINGQSVADRDYFKKGINGIEGVYIVDKGKSTGAQSIVYAVPVIKNGVATGVVCGAQEYTTYQGMLNNEFFSKQGYSIVVDENGNIVIEAVSKNYDKDVHSLIRDVTYKGSGELKKLSEDLRDGVSGIVEYETKETDKMAAYAPLEFNRWSIISVVPSYVAREQTIKNMLVTLILGCVVVISMISFFLFASFKQIKNKKLIERYAYKDALTNGLNLNKFKELASARIAKSNNITYAIMRLDINNFKIINDMYGFAEGDIVLKNIHKTLGIILDEEDVYARVQNDEFIVLVEYSNNEDLESINRAFRETFLMIQSESDLHYVVNFTVGVYIVGPNEKDIVQIIEKASMAHRKGKLTGGKRLQIYDEEIREDAIKEKNIENKMQSAMSNDEFIIYYQPKNRLVDDKIVGAEALIRWENKDGTIALPGDFVPTFEKNGFIVTIDLFVLEETCKLLKRWIDTGIEPVTVSVNQSKLLVSRKDYVETIYAIVSKYNIPTNLIEIELTETIIYENMERLNYITEKLKNMGFRISIDDFGSGYSSLNMLKDIEVDVLKIDRGFLCMAEMAERGKIVLSNIIKMAKELNMSIVTEGVETEKQASLLRSLNCDVAQGFLYSKPMPAPEFEKLLLKRGK